MQESKHTPGPWKLAEGRADGGYLGIWKEGTTTVVCRLTPISMVGPEDFANGHLIAAAPDLLEALINLHAPVLHQQVRGAEDCPLCALITKATGGNHVEQNS